ncbi:hypothetical protein J6590_002050 [Homalodisca vitripennis]|nr:hypothetical protein J6590_002050 [Homalodisca vitripennis]
MFDMEAMNAPGPFCRFCVRFMHSQVDRSLAETSSCTACTAHEQPILEAPVVANSLRSLVMMTTPRSTAPRRLLANHYNNTIESSTTRPRSGAAVDYNTSITCETAACVN